MRSQMVTGLVVAMMATAACTNKDNNDRGRAGAGPDYGQGSDYNGNGWNQNIPGNFTVQKLSTRAVGGQGQTIITIPGFPLSDRGNFEKIRIGCADSTRNNFQNSDEAITMIDGAELAVIGDTSRDKPNTLIVCNDGNVRDDRSRRQGPRRFDKITANSLRDGQSRDIVLTPARRGHQERITIRVTCSADLVTQMDAGINLSRGSTIVVNQDVQGSTGFQGRFQGRGQPPLNNGQRGRIDNDFGRGGYPNTPGDRTMTISCE